MKEMREPANRAVQFSAFDALKGYQELLAGVREGKLPPPSCEKRSPAPPDPAHGGGRQAETPPRKGKRRRDP